jgi:hypothetical protein
MIVIVLVLVAVIVYQRWQIGDVPNNIMCTITTNNHKQYDNKNF